MYFPTVDVREAVYGDDGKTIDRYITRQYSVLKANSQSDVFSSISSTMFNRPDVYEVPADELSLRYTYMFKVVSLSELSSEDIAYSSEANLVQYKIAAELGRALYNFPITFNTEYAEWTSGSPVTGKHLIHSKKIISYGDPSFGNIVYSSEPGSFITPLTYAADVVTGSSGIITSVTPWRSYLAVATKSSISLLIPQDLGWTSKTLTTFVGIPEADSKCCLPGLNGIIYRWGNSGDYWLEYGKTRGYA
jgi:hypothetical protein